MVTLHPTFSPMKKTRLLGYFLAAAACALSVPACGGGGENAGTYASVQQFAHGARQFNFQASPNMLVYASGDSGVSMTEEVTKELLENSHVGPAAPPQGEVVSTSGAYEGRQNIQGFIRMPSGPVEIRMTYATFGGETGTGILDIYPQSGVNNNNSEVVKDIAHFFSAVVPTDVQVSSGGTLNTGFVGFDSDYKRFLLFSIAGCEYHIELDFSSGLANCYLRYQSQVEDVAVYDGNGNLMEDVTTTWSGTIDAIRIKKPFISEAR